MLDLDEQNFSLTNNPFITKKAKLSKPKSVSANVD